MKRRTVVIVAACFAVIGVLGFLALNRGSPSPKAALPVPNGYDDFMAAGKSTVPLSGGLSKLSAEELRAAVCD